MKNYRRSVVLPKSVFQKGSFRTIDVGRPKHTVLVIGRLKSGPHVGKTRTHEVLLHK
jgi:hypothetical protein